jgi:hypothetical protein
MNIEYTKGQHVIAPIKGVDTIARIASIIPRPRTNSVTYVVVGVDDKKGEGYAFGPASLRAA